MTGSVAFNLALPWTRDWIAGCRLNRRAATEIVGRAVRDFGIKAADPEQPVVSLSGGNQQKVVVAMDGASAEDPDPRRADPRRGRRRARGDVPASFAAPSRMAWRWC